ncbi:hypothetical protein D3C72_1579680 [compost metagenome]
MAKAEMIEIAIFPSAIPSAMIRLFFIMVATGDAASPTPWNSTVRKFSIRWLPGISVMGESSTCSAVSVDATKVRYTGNATTTIPRISTTWVMTSRIGRRSTIFGRLSCQYWTLRSTNRNCTTVSAMTITISTTDCAAEPPMSMPRKPSWNTL